MKKTFFLRNFIFAAALSFVACGEDDPIVTTLNVSPSTVSLGSENGSSDIFQITSNAAWTAIVDPDTDWFQLSESSGPDDATVTVTATGANTDTAPRSATITIAAGGETRDVTIEQAGQATFPATIYELKADSSDPAGVVFSLQGTQSGVSYNLLCNGMPVGKLLQGTGAAAAFAGNFIGEGVYTARSITSDEYDQTDMAGSFTITHTSGTSSTMYYATEQHDKNNPGFFMTGIDDGQEDIKIGNVDRDIQCMEYVNGTAYGITYDINTKFNDLVKVDLNTGALTVIKSSIAADGIGLAFNPVDNKTYVTTYDSKFGTIDLLTGDFTVIKTWMRDERFTIAIDNEGVCYAQAVHGIANAEFGKFDLTTGDFTKTTTRDEVISFVQNMEIDRMTGKLYWARRIHGSGNGLDSTFMEVDKTTGSCTELEKFTHTSQSFLITATDGYTVTETVL